MNRLFPSKDYTDNLQSSSHDFEDTHSVANSLEDANLDINVDLRNYLNKRKVYKSESILNVLVDKQIVYLKNNSKVVNKAQKNIEIERVIEENKQRKSIQYEKGQLKSVRSRLIQERNPNVKNFLKDLNETNNDENNSLDKLQNDLKKEFSTFLNTTVDNSLENVKSVNSSSPQNEVRKPSSKDKRIFLTQHEDELIDQELADLFNKPSGRKASSRLTTTKKEEKQISEKKQADESNMQVALVETDDESKAAIESQKAVIRLKKMIDSIKKIDLPKFQTELHQICQYGADPQLFKFYPKDVEYNLENKKNDLGRYCVHECCIKGNIEMLRGLLKYITDVNTLDKNMQNAAHICAKHGELECLRLLAANGIDLRQRDGLGMEPSHVAAYYNQPRILEFLFEMGVPMTEHCSGGKAPLHYACESGALDSVRTLSGYCADVSMCDRLEANTGAHWAARFDRLDCLKLLASLGLPLDLLRNELGRTVAHVCCLHGSVRSLHWLLENFDFHRFAIDKMGNTLAHCSCLGGHPECLNCCIQHDFWTDAENNFNETPLDLGRKSGKGLLIQKAIRNQIRCEYCEKIARRVKWEKEHEKTKGEKIVEKNKDSYYDFNSIAPNPRLLNRVEKTTSNRDSDQEFTAMKRDFIAQYFGPEI